MKFYAGIGSRKTPDDVLALMERIARFMAHHGYWLRSGHAEGADQAFERGAGANAEVYLPWPKFNAETAIHPGAEVHVSGDVTWAAEVAAQHHPAWERLSRGARALMTRNTLQVLGYGGSANSERVICWTPEARGGGGTGQAIRIARANGIRVLDLADPDVRRVIERAVTAWESHSYFAQVDEQNAAINAV